MKKRLICAISLACILVTLFGTVVLAAWKYKFPTTVTDTSLTNRTYYPASLGYTGQSLIDAGYIDSDGLNTNMQVGTSNVKYMIGTTKVFGVVPSLPSGGKSTLDLYAGYSPDQTAFSIITGDGGYITTTDAAALELGNNFEVELSGYFNSATTQKNIVKKDGAYQIWYDSAGNITAGICDTTVSQLVGGATQAVSGVNWNGQTFTTPAYAITISSVSLQFTQTGGADTITVSIRDTDGAFKPTGANLTSATATEATAVINFDFADIVLQASTLYAIVVSVNGDGADIHLNVTNPYAGGTQANSADSGVTWALTAANDLYFNAFAYTGARVTHALTSGSYVIKTTADAANHKLYIDTVEEASTALGGLSVPNTANNIIFNQTLSVPYWNYIKWTVGGVLIAWYQPNTMILATALPDRQGADQNGTFTFGTNTSISLAYGAMDSYESMEATGAVDEGYEQDNSPLPQRWFAAGENLANLPAYASFINVSIQTGLPIQTIYFWVLIGIAISLFLFIVTTTRSALFGVAVMQVVLFVGASMTIIPSWIPFAILIVDVGIMYLYKQVSY